jgi:hypothetical protein
MPRRITLSLWLRLPLLNAVREERLLGVKRVPQRDFGIPRFTYDEGLAQQRHRQQAIGGGVGVSIGGGTSGYGISVFANANGAKGNEKGCEGVAIMAAEVGDVLQHRFLLGNLYATDLNNTVAQPLLLLSHNASLSSYHYPYEVLRMINYVLFFTHEGCDTNCYTRGGIDWHQRLLLGKPMDIIRLAYHKVRSILYSWCK